MADDLVLLALDGGDDVTHAPRARTPECGEERPRSPEGEPTIEQTLVGGVAFDALG